MVWVVVLSVGAMAQVYLGEDGAQTGSFTQERLKAKVANGTLTPDTLARQQGMTNWTPAGQVEALRQ